MPDDSPLTPEDLHALGHFDRRVLRHFIRRSPLARDPHAAFNKELTFGQRVADRVAAFGGSWTFIGLFVAGMTVWILMNIWGVKPADPYPFILLNLVLSCLAALQAPVIMMSQNRQNARDRVDARHDYEVNLKAEMEIVSLHLKMDELRERQWAALLEMQNRQLELLAQIKSVK